jgi:RNA polymerase sigma-70 factor (ECF subfamily)
MADTSLSLLHSWQLEPSEAAWQQLVELYGPFLRSWLIQQSLLPSDAQAEVQEILVVVRRELPQFTCEPGAAAFRRWLLHITIKCLREFQKAKKSAPTPLADERFLQTLDVLEDPTSELGQLWEREHDLYVTRALLDQLKPDFDPKAWRAFEMLLFEGMMPARVARALAMTPNAVLVAKSQVTAKLRNLGAGLID